MPRDAGGNYTLAAGNPVASGTIISTTWANPTMDDLAVAMTESLSRLGNGGMLVPFDNVDGTVLTPGITFTNEVSSGIYRALTNDVRMSIEGEDTTRWINATAQPAGSQQPFEIWNGSAWKSAMYDGGALETVLANNTFLQSRNAADDGVVDIVKVNASDEIEFGAALAKFNSDVFFANADLTVPDLFRADAQSGVQPRILWDTGDYNRYRRDVDQWEWVIGSSIILTVASGALTVPSSARLNGTTYFANTALTTVDQFRTYALGGERPGLQWGVDTYNEFHRTEKEWRWVIDSVEIATMTATNFIIPSGELQVINTAGFPIIMESLGTSVAWAFQNSVDSGKITYSGGKIFFTTEGAGNYGSAGTNVLTMDIAGTDILVGGLTVSDGLVTLSHAGDNKNISITNTGITSFNGAITITNAEAGWEDAAGLLRFVVTNNAGAGSIIVASSGGATVFDLEASGNLVSRSIAVGDSGVDGYTSLVIKSGAQDICIDSQNGSAQSAPANAANWFSAQNATRTQAIVFYRNVAANAAAGCGQILSDFYSPKGVAGTFRADGTLVSASDGRFKENVVTIQDGMATIKALNPVTYDLIASGAEGMGFIAQEVQTVVPLAVSLLSEDDDKLGMDKSMLIAPMVRALQQIDARLTQLEPQ